MFHQWCREILWSDGIYEEEHFSIWSRLVDTLEDFIGGGRSFEYWSQAKKVADSVNSSIA